MQTEKIHDAIVKMDRNAESLARSHGSGEALFKRRLAITVILFVVSIMMPDTKIVLHEEDIRDGHQCWVDVHYILDHPVGD
jgi:hypothetical protein